MKQILIFGGESGLELLNDALDFSKVHIRGFLNNNKNLIGTKIRNYDVFSIQEGILEDFDYIIIGSISYLKEMVDQLISFGIPYSKIVVPQFLYRKSAGDIIYQEMQQYNKENDVFKDDLAQKNRDYSVVFMNRKLEKPQVHFYDYPDYLLQGVDLVRLNTIELLSREITNRKIDGAIAELGVYRGDLSRFLSDIFPNRELILFDTFEGFDSRDVEIERQKDYSSAVEKHLDNTDEDIVLSKIKNTSKVQIVKGYFPESVEEFEDKKYAFVSIDVDLYNPILTGLEYFYERLEVGGYIIVHDYNFPHYSGVKKAVNDFTQKTGIYSVPICDHHGSTIFMKNK